MGLPDAAVRESEKRIFTSSESCGINIQSAEISINLAPADKKKEGTAMELAILIAVYQAVGIIDGAQDCTFIGEISFSGEVRHVRGVLGMTIAAINSGRKRIFVPLANLKEASVAYRDGVEIYGVDNINSLVAFLRGELSCLEKA